MRTTKRTYKDSLFRDIFNNVHRLTQIYASLEDETVEANDIKLTTMDEVFFDSGRSTSAAHLRSGILRKSIVNTLTRNPPIAQKVIALPAPKFYVLYNGRN